MKRSPFNLSHYKLLTMNMGQLVPLTQFQVMPLDTIQMETQALIRAQQLLAPLMHPVQARIHHWYVPFRILWEDWEDFITGGEDGTSKPTPPYLSTSAVSQGSLGDYMGVPVGSWGGVGAQQISILPFRAYALIWNEFYRDKDIQTELAISTASGYDTTTSLSLQNVCWEKDYFTTCRSFSQRGTDVTIPAAGDLPVKGIGTTDRTYGSSAVSVYESDDSNPTYGAAKQFGTSLYVERGVGPSGNIPAIRVDTGAFGVDISDLRMALAEQAFQERMKNSPDYYDYLRMLGVGTLDGRLQKPEYLGGGKVPMQFSEVLSTDGANTGSLYGHGIGAMKTNRFRRFIPEHGVVISTMSVVPKSIYANGLHRNFFKTVKEAFFQKEYEHTGDQVVYNKEVFLEHATPDGTFGYQNRYDEYRSIPSQVHGEFQDASLDHWHLARMFGSDPALNSTFISCNPATRPYAAPSTDQLYVYANNQVRARRPMKRHPKARVF
jgi:hypothetical protein